MKAEAVKKFLALFSVVLAVLYLSACTQILTATPDEIIIVQESYIEKLRSNPAAREAAEHCAQYGKAARLTSKTGRVRRYACEHGS